MAAIEVRAAVASDLPQFMGLDHSSETDHVWQLELRREHRSSQIVAAFREVRLPRPVALVYPNDQFALADDWTRKAMLLAAIAGNDAIGYLAISEPRTSIGWITDLIVAPRRRRQGVAGALLKAAHLWAEERGHRKLFIEMQSKNHPAISLVQKNGYEFCGYNDSYYSNQDITLMFVRAV
jgi:ribosomal protein S18 acetylase RimI-like enzyme